MNKTYESGKERQGIELIIAALNLFLTSVFSRHCDGDTKTIPFSVMFQPHDKNLYLRLNFCCYSFLFGLVCCLTAF